jgi:hypothetical protein
VKYACSCHISHLSCSQHSYLQDSNYQPNKKHKVAHQHDDDNSDSEEKPTASSSLAATAAATAPVAVAALHHAALQQQQEQQHQHQHQQQQQQQQHCDAVAEKVPAAVAQSLPDVDVTLTVNTTEARKEITFMLLQCEQLGQLSSFISQLWSSDTDTLQKFVAVIKAVLETGLLSVEQQQRVSVLHSVLSLGAA